MAKHGKNYRERVEKVDKTQPYSVKDALKLVKDTAYAKFDESVDVHVNLSIDAAKSDQNVRGSVLLPNQVGAQPRVIVFAKGDFAAKAEKAGADLVGTDDLISKIEGGWLDFDYAVATPDLMGAVGRLAKILGPRGLLPNKKVGTVTFEVAEIVNDLKKGRAFFKNDKGGSVHFKFGKVSQDVNNLLENLNVFFRALLASKPATSKGKFVKKVTVTSTMGLGVPVDADEVARV